ncbi:MAG: hypothetical protein QXN53_03765 [Thermoproteota archaeon]
MSLSFYLPGIRNERDRAVRLAVYERSTLLDHWSRTEGINTIFMV